MVLMLLTSFSTSTSL
ncbi:unnamed protein product, partial [Allacma fusca]